MTTVTYTHLSAKLLRDAAGFFRNVADQNPALADEMRDNANVYDEAASLLSTNPNGTVEPDDDDPGA